MPTDLDDFWPDQDESLYPVTDPVDLEPAHRLGADGSRIRVLRPDNAEALGRCLQTGVVALGTASGIVDGPYEFGPAGGASLTHRRRVRRDRVVPRSAVTPMSALQDVRPLFDVRLAPKQPFDDPVRVDNAVTVDNDVTDDNAVTVGSTAD